MPKDEEIYVEDNEQTKQDRNEEILQTGLYGMEELLPVLAVLTRKSGIRFIFMREREILSVERNRRRQKHGGSDRNS